MTDFNVDYFIAKFEAIPEQEWCIGKYENDVGQHCALGHCGKSYTNFFREAPEADALLNLISDNNLPVASINDGLWDQYQQPTPKQRILAALMCIKEGQNADH